MNFHVGQKVVCIGEFRGGYGDETDPIMGCVYTIRDIDLEKCGDDPIGLRFEEVINPSRFYLECDEPIECSFSARKFRPLLKRKTDISIFTALLNPTPAKVLDHVMQDTLAEIYLSSR